ncbi:phage tail protein [Enterobacter kobei]|uniref:phage tail-collar fiber domain-containing protein n=1 Tax=Enterobacter kobei TaxID=208224 RepID=UPI002B1E08E4|nr:phage tail protein [Enterobacter kobei]MEA3824696.1 phage tail protein [Enterobacter kobei]MEA4242149.1 phage tail protein [Enterobacter kobei]
MSQTAITLAFEQWKASQAVTGEAVLLDEFIFANVPGLDATKPVDRKETLPPAAQIVHRQAVSRKGVVNENSVVHSVVLGAEVGDFSFNWIGLINKASNTLAMIVHAPLQQKLKTKDGQQGNVLTRSFLMEYNGAQAETGINTPAETWQIDFTARMAGMDERQRLENIDLYGAAAFLGDGWLVAKSGSQYFVTAGAGYVRGLRAQLAANQNITVATKPVKVWLDVAWTGTLTSAWNVASKVTVADNMADYVQSGVQHYVFAVASIDASGNIIDLRPKGSLNAQSASDALKKHEQSRNHPDATTAAKGFTQLSSATDSTSESLAATPKAVKAVSDAVIEVKKTLGTAASKDVQTSKDDVTAGRVLVNGGALALRTVLAGAGRPVTDFDDLPENAVSFGYDNATNTPGFTGSVLDYSGSNGRYRVQLAAQYNGNGNRLAFRTRNGDSAGAWNAWGEIYHTRNKPKPADINAVDKGGDTMTGTLKVNGEVQAASANGFRIAYGDYGTFWRNDGNNLYLMLTNKGDAYGAYNALRPLWVNLTTGALQSGTPLSVNNTIDAGKEITAGYSGNYGWVNQYNTKAPFFNSYITTGASEYHPVIKQMATITGKNSWAFSMGTLVSGDALSWHLHMKGSGSGDINYKWDVNGNFSAPGQIIPGNFANFDGRYYTKTLIDAGYMPKTGAYTKAESDGRFQPKGSYTPAGQAYTKAESDGRFQPKGSYTPAGQAYTKAESDGRYPLKTATVIGVRVSARGSIGSTGGSQDVDAPVGSFITGRTGSNGDVRYSVWYTRALQINVNGTWKTITA